MGTFVGVLLLASFLAVFATITLFFALSMAGGGREVELVAAQMRRRPEQPPSDADYPRLPL